jgi:hypothetical protein
LIFSFIRRYACECFDWFYIGFQKFLKKQQQK